MGQAVFVKCRVYSKETFIERNEINLILPHCLVPFLFLRFWDAGVRTAQTYHCVAPESYLSSS
jgi:hypothetical protein